MRPVGGQGYARSAPFVTGRLVGGRAQRAKPARRNVRGRFCARRVEKKNARAGAVSRAEVTSTLRGIPEIAAWSVRGPSRLEDRMSLLPRLTRRFVGGAFVAATLTTGIVGAPAQGATVNVSTSSVQLTGAVPAPLAPAEAMVKSRSLESAGGSARAVDPEQPASPGYHAVVQNPNGGQLVGLRWSGSPNAVLQIRSRNGDTWSPWLDASADSYGGADRGGKDRVTPGVGPIWVGHDAQQIEVRVDNGTLSNLRLDSMHFDVAGGAGGIATAGAATLQPAFISRAEWGAATWGTGVPDCGSGPSTSPLKFAVVHHTASGNNYSPSDSYGIVRSIQQFELSRGFCDISYNFLVSRYGQVFEGRAGSIYSSVIGAHARGSNTGSVGVALIGQYQPGASPPVGSVPAVQYNAVRDLLAWKFAWHGIDPTQHVTMFTACVSDASYTCKYPTGTFLSIPPIVGHRDVTSTSCPGQNMYKLLPRLRADVAARVVRSGPFGPLAAVRWTPDPSAPKVLTLDAFGGVHPAGGATSQSVSTYWPGFAIARDITGTPTAGYELDGFGGLWAYGTAPRIHSPAYWRGWDIVRGVSLASNQRAGYVLDGYGGVHPFGGATAARPSGYWNGWDIARDIVTLPAGNGGYVLDGWGGIWAFGAAPKVTSGAPYWPGRDIARAIALNPDGPGLYVLDALGGVHAVGGAPRLNSSLYVQGDVARDFALLPGGRGYVLDRDGHAWPIGNAPRIKVFLSLTGYNLGRGVVAG
jgi:hypothetical protein